MLLGARQSILQANLEDNHLSFLILSKMIDLCSRSQTDGIYKAPTSTKRAILPSVALDRVYSMILEDVKSISVSTCSLENKSSEDMSEVCDRSISTIITSPPYLNNFDYAEMTRMYLYFWGIADSWGEITDKVRANLIVNTTTALKGHKPKQEQYRSTLSQSVRHEADEIVASLCAERQVRAGKKEYDFLVYPYFSQMQNVLRESLRVMTENGRFHMMVADAALYGVHVPSPQILARIMEDIGFANVRCELVRKRGHRWVLEKRDGSKTGLGEYYVYGERI
jgi:DNA modification methylase